MKGELAALEEGLGRRAAVAAARSILELMQDTVHVMSKVCASLVLESRTPDTLSHPAGPAGQCARCVSRVVAPRTASALRRVVRQPLAHHTGPYALCHSEGALPCVFGRTPSVRSVESSVEITSCTSVRCAHITSHPR